MLNGMEKPDAELQKMDNAVLKATAQYIVNTVYNGTNDDDFSILPDMINAYIKLRKDFSFDCDYDKDEFVNLVSECLESRSISHLRNQQ